MVNHPSRYGLFLALSMVLLAPPARAQAPQRERIALHPCVITGARKASTSGLEATCATASIRESMNLIPSTDVHSFLEKERGSCARTKNRDACLGRLAAATQASRVLYITLNPFTPKSTRITGLVVDDAGKKLEEKVLELPRLANQPPRDVVRFAVSQLLDQLDVAKAPVQDVFSVPLTPGAEPEPEPTPVPVAAPSPAPLPPSAPVASLQQEAPRGRTWKTPAGITAMAVGGAGLIVSGLLVNSGNSKAKKFNDAFTGKLPRQDELPGLIQQRDDAKSQQKLGTVTALTSVALGLGGAALWWMDRPTSPASASAPPKVGTPRLLAGPGHVGVLVVLP